MAESKIISSITSNTDDYSWRDLNCMYKPVAIILKSFDEKLFDSFLAYYSFINIYGLDETLFNFEAGNFVHPLFLYLKDTLHQNVNVSIENKAFAKEKDFHKYLIESINEGKIPLVPGNLRGLYYNTMFRLKDHLHCFIIKGYDKKRNLYYILDNMHVDEGASTIYKDFTIRCEDLYELYYLEKKPFCFFFSRQGEIDIAKIAVLLKNKIFEVIKHSIEPKLIEQSFIEDLQKKEHFNELDEKLVVANMRRVFLESTVKIMLDYGAPKEEIFSLKEEYNSCIKKWCQLRTKLIMLNENSFSKCQDIVPKIDEYFDNDIKVLELFYHLFETLNISDKSKKSEKYIIKNNKNAVLEVGEKKIHIVLESKNVYDEWINKQDAPKILWNVWGKNFSFCTKIDIDAKTGSSFFTGILIETEDEKFYFGNIKNTQTVIFVPCRAENYTVYEKNFAVRHIKIEYSLDGKLLFYIKKDKYDSYELVYTEMLNSSILCTGLFAKSWESAQADITLSVDEKFLNQLK